ncbi:MAG: GtrA family protein [Streptosporangiaceae bacterium]
MSWAERAWQLRRSHHVVRLTRYGIGSAVGAVVAEAVFVLSYALFDHITPTMASAIAFFAGAVPKYFLNRDWVWGERDGSRRWRELARYAAVVVFSIAVSATTTTLVEARAGAVSGDHSVRVLLVGATYAVTFVVLFFVRYIVFDKLVFVGPGRGDGGRGGSDGDGTGGDAPRSRPTQSTQSTGSTGSAEKGRPSVADFLKRPEAPLAHQEAGEDPY